MATSVPRKPLLARIFQRLPKSSAAHVPFRIRCTCGQTISGVRKRQPIELICPKCSTKLFVLPRTAWPPVTGATPVVPEAAPAPLELSLTKKPPAKVWLLPLWVGLFALLTAAWCVWVYGPQVMRSGRVEQLRPFQECDAAAQAAVQKGEFLQAAHHMNEAIKTWSHDASPPNRTQQAEYYRLLDQVRILAELSPRSLEEIVAWAEDQEKRPAAERTLLKTQFPQRVFVFDSHLHAPPPQFLAEQRGVAMDYQLQGTTLPVSWDLSNQEGLTRLIPLEKSQRWLIALRLDSVELRADEQQPKGRWVIRFEPNAAVLLTEAKLFRAWRLEGEFLPEMLERQQRMQIAAPRFQLGQQPVLLGATRPEVREAFRSPDVISRQIWQRHYSEQWHYRQRRQAINFHSANGSVPKVVQTFKLVE